MKFLGLALALLVSAILASCGGTSSTPNYPLGGSITGLTTSGLVLASGGQTVAPISTATTFAFGTPLPSGTSYAVTVQTQPATETCVVTSGTGTAAAASASSVVVTCTVNQSTLTGTITSLTASGLVLATGGQTVAPAANATSFAFGTALANGSSYAVTVLTQPVGLTCTVSNGAGSIPVATPVTVACIVSSGSMVSTLAGNGTLGRVNGPATTASFFGVDAIGFDSAGNFYVAESNNQDIREISAAGVVSTFAGNGVPNFVNGPAATASFFGPAGVAVDSAGNVYVGDNSNHAIRKISAVGVVSTLAGTGAHGFTNGPGTTATFYYPQGVAVDSAGNVYVADTFNNAIRKISAAGVVSTLAGTGAAGFVDGPAATASFSAPAGVAVDSAGNVYVADTANNAIRKISPLGVVSTMAGTGAVGFVNGTAATASFSAPAGVAVDSAGNAYVADTSNNAIRKISASGLVSTLAGGTAGSVNGPAATASFFIPTGIAVDGTGNVYVTDRGTGIIRKITP